MTPLETRVLALEQDVLVLCQAINNLTSSQTLFATLASAQLRSMVDSVQRLRKDLIDDGDEFEGFR